MARTNEAKLHTLVHDYLHTSSAPLKNNLFNQIARILNGQIKFLLNDYYVEGLDYLDIRQLCLIELWEVLEDGHYNPEMDFTAYASVRMKRNILNHIKRSRAKQRYPYKKQVQSLEEDRGGGATGSFITDTTVVSPVNRVISAEERKAALWILKAVRERCSRLEARVLDELLISYRRGKYPDYARVARELGIDLKSVDNARERMTRKCHELDKRFRVFDSWVAGQETQLTTGPQPD